MARLHYNNLQGLLAASPTLTNVATTINFAAALTYNGGVSVPTIVAPDYIPITLEPGTANFEVVSLTAYTSGATTGTITRGVEGSAVAHGPSVAYDHSFTVADYNTFQQGYATIGGTTIDVSAPYGAVKKFTLSTKSLLLGITMYTLLANDSVSHFEGALFADVSGVPGNLIGYGGGNAYDAAINAGGARWLHIPMCTVVLAAGTYWMGAFVLGASNTTRFYYDGSGTDYSAVPNGGWVTDKATGSTTWTLTTRQYSVYADLMLLS